MRKIVVVLGKNYSTPLGVIRSLSKAGYTVELLYIAKKKGDSQIVASSKHLSRTVEIVGRHDEQVIDSLVSEFGRTGTRSVLFPTDDYTASLIDRFKESLQDLFEMPYVIDGSVTQMMDKSVQGALAQKCGMKTAREWVVSLNTDTIRIPEDIVFPCFVKPMVSAFGGKDELEKCENAQSLGRKLQKMQARLRERSVLVQEFLNIQQEYTIGGVCNDQEVFIPAIIRKSMIAQHNRGITLEGTVVDTSEISNELPEILAVLRSVRYVGMFDLEVLRTDRGLYFGELNLRCGGPSYSYFRCGINLPDCAIHAILHESFDAENKNIELNKRFFNNKVAWEDYMDGYLSKSDMRHLYQDCDFSLISDKDDPTPEKVFQKTMEPLYKQRRLKKKIRSLLPK